ncbi:MAG: 3-dehydroquinate synthase [Bacteroidales bacterium]|jgi:3-dehydroquinate synthase|nr:3-dehydroquinate synthase [Bacteroidales bacterium]
MDIIRSLGYDIFIGDDVALQLPAQLSKYDRDQTVVLVDENTQGDCLPLLELFKNVSFLVLPSGERHKNMETATVVWDFLFENRIGRKGLLVNLGGGVLSDIGAFCASVWNRGIDFVNLPTSLLSMVDASVGGKTGIDFHYAKNKIGTFSSPQAVFINPLFLRTLSQREMMSGFAEMIKHAIICNDLENFERLQKLQSVNFQNVTPFIAGAVSIKNKIVMQDPYEKNIRKILNFGHTAGHALESVSLQSDRPLLHGETIAMGMKVEIELARRKGMLSKERATLYTHFINRFYSNLILPKIDFKQFMDFVKHDKKSQSGRFFFAFPDEKNGYAVDVPVNECEIEEALSCFNLI